jgi:ribosomal protein S18 acetylase RimI-like enzyme
MNMPLAFRRATPSDAEMLGRMNQQLIQDEGHSNPMTLPELQGRMRVWLTGEYTAVIFEDNAGVAAYALFREEPQLIYLRQLFVHRDRRRRGYGLEAVLILQRDFWPARKRVTVDVLVTNQAALDFWRKAGFRDYCLTLESTAA